MQPSSTTTVLPAPPPEPAVFYVPRNITTAVLNTSPQSTTPESITKSTLLSNHPNKNTVALVGMGGAGKTTILRALGRCPEIWNKFSDIIWFIQLGPDATMHSLLLQMQLLVQYAFPDFLQDFKLMIAVTETRETMIAKLTDLMAARKCLILFDDVWDGNECSSLVHTMWACIRQKNENALKALISTRSTEIACSQSLDRSINVVPEQCSADKAVQILLCCADIDFRHPPALSADNRRALGCILEKCAGLPLALGVAGSSIRGMMDPAIDITEQGVFVDYWERLEANISQLGRSEIGNYKGLFVSIKLSLSLLESQWRCQHISIEAMFRSLCVLLKQMFLPLSAAEKLWGVSRSVAKDRMLLLSQKSVVSVERNERGSILGLRIHDVVHDLSVEMAEEAEGVMMWHEKLLEGYRHSTTISHSADDTNGQTSSATEWWDQASVDKYFGDNAVRHILGAGRGRDALELLTDYRWIQNSNKDEDRVPFQKTLAEVQLLRLDFEKKDKTETGRRVLNDITVIERAMELSSPFCVKNQKECTFQLHGRLRNVSSESGVVERIVCSIERYGRRPWARAGPGVLKSGKSALKRVLRGSIICMCVESRGRVLVGGRHGDVWVLNSRDGTMKKSLAGHREEGGPVVGVFLDRSSFWIYSCNIRGQVIIWKEYEKWRSMQAGLQDEETTSCMQVLPSQEKVVLGTVRGRLIVMDIQSSTTTQTVDAHAGNVSSLAMSRAEDIMVSGSKDGEIRVWDTTTFEDSARVFEGHTNSVFCLALAVDGTTLASGSADGTIRIWDVQRGELVWTSPNHKWVPSVLFSSDGRILYSTGALGICVWRVNNSGRDVSLVHTFVHLQPSVDRSLCIPDGSELLTLSTNGVNVWDTRQVGGINNVGEDVFLPDVERFAVSEDAATMLTWNSAIKFLEIRNVEDVSERTDRVIYRYQSQHDFYPSSLAVSNDRRLIAYERRRGEDCNVTVVDTQNGNVLHSFPGNERWGLSSTPNNRGVASQSPSSGNQTGTTCSLLSQVIESIRFSPDGSVISAVAAARERGGNGAILRKLKSWHVLSGELLHEAQLDRDSNLSTSTALPRLVCNKQLPNKRFRFPNNVTYEGNDSSFTIATLEGSVGGTHFLPDTSRMFISRRGDSVCYVDLVTESTHLPPRDEPPLPLLSQPSP